MTPHYASQHIDKHEKPDQLSPPPNPLYLDAYIRNMYFHKGVNLTESDVIHSLMSHYSGSINPLTIHAAYHRFKLNHEI